MTIGVKIQPEGTPVQVPKRRGRKFVRSGKPRGAPKPGCCGRGLSGGKKLVPKK